MASGAAALNHLAKTESIVSTRTHSDARTATHTHASLARNSEKKYSAQSGARTNSPTYFTDDRGHTPPPSLHNTLLPPGILILLSSMGVADKDSATEMEFDAAASKPWGWEGEAPVLSPEQTAMLDATIAEVKASPLCSDAVAQGGRSAVWRYLEGAQWRAEPARGKSVSDFFVETLAWRAEGGVDTVLERGHAFEAEAASGKLFVRGSSLLGRPLIWLHAGRENNALDPEANIRFLVYTVVRWESGT